MTTDSIARFTIRVGETDRRLFSISEKKKTGTLYIKIKRSPRVSLPGLSLAHMIPLPQTVKTQKYSIHPSKDSKENINYIHHTILFENGEKLESEHVTKAIKSGESFAFLYCTRCPDLRSPSYALDPSGVPNLSLGTYNADAFTLFYAVIVGAVEREWKTSMPEHVNIEQRSFGKLRIIVLWSFVPLPSIAESLTYHTRTYPPETTGEIELDRGFSESECLAKFEEQLWILEEGVRMHFVHNHCDIIPGQPIMVPVKRFFADGNTITEKTNEYISTLQERILTLPPLGRGYRG